MDQTVIQCQGVTKAFGIIAAVHDISLSLAEGEILSLVGPSGSGKTTLMRLVAGFETPDSGTIALRGRVVAGGGAWVQPESRSLGMVFQDYALFPHMTVVQNVAYGLKGWSRDDKARRVQEMLELVRISHLTQVDPFRLSGGEQQRVALARSLAPQPVALLLDEPFSNLDPHLRIRLRQEVRDIIHDSGVAAIHVTHDQDEALFMGDRVAVMNSGSLEQIGTPEEVFHHPRTRFAGRFLGIADFVPGKMTEDGLATEIGTLRPEDQIQTGTDVEVMVRGDDMSLRACASGSGLVVSRIFRGMHYLYGVSLPSGALVYSLQHHTLYLELGDRVEIHLEPNQLLTCFVKSDSAAEQDVDPSFSAVTDEGTEGV